MDTVEADYHPSFQHIAFLDQETGDCGERAAIVNAEQEENDERRKKKTLSGGKR
jgi:hypothetical protein